MSISVSVIIPTYNRSADLRRALESIATQTLQPHETIVCDDGSEEDIQAVVDQIKPRLNVHYIRIQKSGGPGRPRNVALSSASGDWVSFLDSDDWWLPRRFEILEPFLQKPVDVVYHRLSIEWATSRPLWKRFPDVGFDCGPDPLLTMIARGNPIPNSAAVVRRASLTAIGGITENFTSVEDFDTWLRLAEAGGAFSYVDLSLGGYSVSGNNISAFSKKQLLRLRELFEHHLPLIPDPLKAFAESHFSYLLGSYAVRLRLLPTAERYLSKVQASKTFPRWVLAMLKRVAIRTPLVHILAR